MDTSNRQPITLDTTLNDLYRLDGDNEEIVLVYAVPTGEVQMMSQLPLDKHFAYQSPMTDITDGKMLARIFLQVVPQLLGFIAGEMPVIMFDLDRKNEGNVNEGDRMRGSNQSREDLDSQRQHRRDAFETFNQLAPHQKPQLRFVSSPLDIVLKAGAKAGIFNPMDCLTHLPHTVDPEIHFELLSKRSLAFSGLPTPPTEVVDVVIEPDQTTNDSLVEGEARRIINRITSRPIPFVVKLPQALAGQGTFLIRDESQRQDTLKVLDDSQYVKRMLHQLTISNAHLHPASLVLQDMMPGEAVALSFFVTKSGTSVFIACCKQLVDDSGHWGGGWISYLEQEELHREWADTIDKAAAYLHGKGYYGPVGIDVMTNGEGEQLIIDMNVRACGSHPLGLLKGHVMRQGLQEAAILFPLFFPYTRGDFDATFLEDLAAGRLVVGGWSHYNGGKAGVGTVILAASDAASLTSLVSRVKKYAQSE